MLLMWTLQNVSGVTLTLGVTVLFLVLALIFTVQRYKFLRTLKSVPGPPALPILGNALILTGGQDDFFRLLKQCAAKFGECFVLWVGQRPFVFLQSAEAVQPILGSTLHIDKSFEYSFLNPWIGTGLLTSTGDKWHSRRKLLTPSFHSRILSDFVQPMQRSARILVARLAHAALDKKVFDVVPFIKKCSLDLILETTMGYHANVQEEQDCEYVNAIVELSAILQRRFITPWLKPEILFQASHHGYRQRKCVKTIHNFTDTVIRERREELQRRANANGNFDVVNGVNHSKGKPRMALLDMLLELQKEPRQPGEGPGMTDEDIREEVNTFLFAGHDTMSLGVSWCLYVFGLHQEIQDPLVSEIRAAQSENSDGELTMRAVLHDMPLLDSCIKEVMRLYPVAPLIARDIKHTVNIGSHILPPGVTVLMNLYLLHRDPKYFSEPERFLPERFLNATDLGNPYAYVPFSAGSRNCIGQKYAMMELKILLAEILLNFEIRSETPPEDLNLMGELVLLNKEGIRISLKPRC